MIDDPPDPLGDEAIRSRPYTQLESDSSLLTMLLEASRVINSSLDLNEIMQSLLAEMNQLLNAEALSIALVDDRTNELVYEVAEGAGSDKIVGLRLPSNEGVSGWVMEHGEPAFVPETSKDPRFSQHGDQRTGHLTRALVCAPLIMKGRVLGTIQAINPVQGQFTQNDLSLLVSLANLASSAIANAQQFARTQAAEARYLGLFEDSIDAIILTDERGHIVEVNQQATDLLGFQRGELLSMHIADLHPQDGGLFESLASSESPWAEGHSFADKAFTSQNRQVPVEVRGRRLQTSGRVVYQWIYRDLSEQVELERMREDLIAMLFHDLQSPLGNIITGLELLSSEISAEDDPELESILAIAMRSSKRLQLLVRSLLDINRLEAGYPVTSQGSVSIQSLIDDAYEMIAPALDRKQLSFTGDVPPELPDVCVDVGMIRRVLINLLDNAIKFSPARQSISIRAADRPEEQEVEVSVVDSGGGIPEQSKEAVFDKFHRIQTDDEARGLGLGLAFCRLAVEAHGGRIWIEDAEHGGAIFKFTLPRNGSSV